MNQPIKPIGPVPIPGLCRLAPMASISNIPFRIVCKAEGSSFLTSEEISAKGLIHNAKNTASIANFLPEEKPISMQLVGANPQELADAAIILQDRGADIVDLNMGCPVKKVVKTGSGSALMRDPQKVHEILKTMRKAIKVPFTIKIRAGWDDNSINAPEIAHIAEEEGVDALTIHGRTRAQGYSGTANRSIIKKVVESVQIPVTGNGDVQNYHDAIKMKEQTGCNDVMIGRAALGAPWCFNPDFINLTPEGQKAHKLQAIEYHMQLIQQYLDERFGLLQMKKHLSWYSKGIYNSTEFRKNVFFFKTPEELLESFRNFWNRSEV